MVGLSIRTVCACSLALCLVGTISFAQDPPPGEQPNLGTVRVTQEMIVDGSLTELQIREFGLRMFTTPFNKLDGYGDGPMDPADTVMPGGRPTLQGNGTFLRVNGLDAQTCLECHSVISNASIPARLGIGGVGGSNSNAMIMPTAMDPADLDDLDSAAGFNGRFANPPFLFGAAGVELLGLEMTTDLHALKQYALDHPGSVVQLATKGVEFGSIEANVYGEIDYSLLEGVDEDLVVKPFGRKGEFPTTRDFDLAAMQFHFGMQPVEVFGANVDPDGDGVENEVLIGEHSALHIFVATIDRPDMAQLDDEASHGFALFQGVGCSSCHMPELPTASRELPLRFPIVPPSPQANVYYTIDLSKNPMKFDTNDQGGVTVPLFADLKRHDMGDALAESFGLVDEQTNREFTTARLWGIADTAPYLHDGRATTLTEAILYHGGEAQQARDNFDALSAQDRQDLLSFLRSLRVPEEPLRGGGIRRSRAGRGGGSEQSVLDRPLLN
jgi:hypothetical protein